MTPSSHAVNQGSSRSLLQLVDVTGDFRTWWNERESTEGGTGDADQEAQAEQIVNLLREVFTNTDLKHAADGPVLAASTTIEDILSELRGLAIDDIARHIAVRGVPLEQLLACGSLRVHPVWVLQLEIA